MLAIATILAVSAALAAAFAQYLIKVEQDQALEKAEAQRSEISKLTEDSNNSIRILENLTHDIGQTIEKVNEQTVDIKNLNSQVEQTVAELEDFLLAKNSVPKIIPRFGTGLSDEIIFDLVLHKGNYPISNISISFNDATRHPIKVDYFNVTELYRNQIQRSVFRYKPDADLSRVNLIFRMQTRSNLITQTFIMEIGDVFGNSDVFSEESEVSTHKEWVMVYSLLEKNREELETIDMRK